VLACRRDLVEAHPGGGLLVSSSQRTWERFRLLVVGFKPPCDGHRHSLRPHRRLSLETVGLFAVRVFCSCHLQTTMKLLCLIGTVENGTNMRTRGEREGEPQLCADG
jgi:hypothetical protein